MKAEMEIVKRKLSELKPNKDNIRMHPDTQIHEYVRSLKQNGQIKTIVIDEDNVIWIGNGLYKAMLEAGFKEAYCQVKRGMTEKQKKKMMLSDNRIFDLGVDDLAAFDRIITDLDGDFDIAGYTDELLNSLVASSDDISDMMSDYGVVDEEKRNAIAEAKKVMPGEETTHAELPYEQSASETHDDASIDTDSPMVPEPTRKCVICPKCGEKIWL